MNVHNRIGSQAHSAKQTQRRDRVDLTAMAGKEVQASSVLSTKPALEPKQLTQQILEAFQTLYPGINIITGDFENEDALEKFAASVGMGKVTLVISPEYLRKVSLDQALQDMERVFSQLNERMQSLCGNQMPFGAGAYISDHGKLSFWATLPQEEAEEQDSFVQQRLEELKKSMDQKAQETKTKKFKFKQKIGYSSMTDTARLIKARTVRDARGIVSKLYSRKYMLGQGKQNYDEGELRTTLAQIDGIIQRAKVKVRKLNQESGLQVRQNHAIKQQQIQKARVLGEELKRARIMRRSKEYAQAFSSCPQLAHLFRKVELEWEDSQTTQNYAEIAASIFGIPAGLPTGGADISVSGAVSAPAAVNVVVATGIDLAI